MLETASTVREPPGLPAAFVAHAQGLQEPGCVPGAEWIRTVPGLIRDALERWELTLADGVRWGHTALVLMVRRADGTPAALKVGWPHPESRQEHLALRTWQGRRAVRLLAADPRAGVLLLERLQQIDTQSLDLVAEAEQVALLLNELDPPALPRVDDAGPHLHELIVDLDAWDAAHPGAGIPRRMSEQARAAASALLGEDAVGSRLLHTDLHGENVLWRAAPGEWVAIDPKPMNAHPALGLAPALWNRWEETLAEPDPRASLVRRFETMVDVLGLDVDLARAAMLVRLVRNALWDLQDGAGVADVTVPVTVIKALDPS